jgi:hypothetical protein
MSSQQPETPDVEHRLVNMDGFGGAVNVSFQCTCSCGWVGHETRWTEHAPDVAPLAPAPPQPRLSRQDLRDAIYGNRRSR